MSVGATLRTKREASALSVREVSNETNIQPWIIEAIENDSIADKMTTFYARGFLNTYARFLQMPSDALLEDLPVGDTASDSIIVPDNDSIPPAVNLPIEEIVRWSKPLAALCAVLLIVWLNPLALFAKFKLPSLTQPQMASVGLSGKGASIEKITNLTIAEGEPLQLSISAKKSTWIQLWSDGKLLVQQKLEGGENEHWKAEDGFKVVVAKPANVDIALNQTVINSALVGYQGRIEISHQGISRINPEDG